MGLLRMSGRGRIRFVRLATCAAVGAAIITSGIAVAASSAHAPMTVSVTVVRSCTVDSRLVTGSSSVIHLTCPSHDTNVLLRTASGDAELLDPSGVHYVTSTHGHQSDASLQVVTLNF